jgi:rhodanese-related sulfurtransferase
MDSSGQASVSEVSPANAWAALKVSPDTMLVDVRTQAEWSYVGLPDLSQLDRTVILSEWRQLPGMIVNDSFGTEVLQALGGAAPSRLFFLCRSGIRSRQAAEAMTQLFASLGQKTECVNVAEGFEGDLDSQGHRGNVNGWKTRGLPWRQT